MTGLETDLRSESKPISFPSFRPYLSSLPFLRLTGPLADKGQGKYIRIKINDVALFATIIFDADCHSCTLILFR